MQVTILSIWQVWAPLKKGKSEEEQNLSYEPNKEF